MQSLLHHCDLCDPQLLGQKVGDGTRALVALYWEIISKNSLHFKVQIKKKKKIKFKLLSSGRFCEGRSLRKFERRDCSAVLGAGSRLNISTDTCT